MDPSLLNTKHKGRVCGVWLSASDVGEAADLVHPAFNTLRCVCFDELLTPNCTTQVSVALTGDLDAGVLEQLDRILKTLRFHNEDRVFWLWVKTIGRPM